MKILSKVASKLLLFGFVITSSMASISHAKAETLDSVSHIHHVKVVGSKVLVLTHEGLYELVGKNDMKLVGKEKIDVMGFVSSEMSWLQAGTLPLAPRCQTQSE